MFQRTYTAGMNLIRSMVKGLTPYLEQPDNQILRTVFQPDEGHEGDGGQKI